MQVHPGGTGGAEALGPQYQSQFAQQPMMGQPMMGQQPMMVQQPMMMGQQNMVMGQTATGQQVMMAQPGLGTQPIVVPPAFGDTIARLNGPNRCTYCGGPVRDNMATMAGLLCCFFLFPCGMIYCCLTLERRCKQCGKVHPKKDGETV